MFGLLVSRKIRSRQEPAATKSDRRPGREKDLESTNARAGRSCPSTQNGSKSLVRVTETALPAKSSRQPIARMPVAAPTSLYGAYRIDQEVGKLVLGQPHRIDVLASRAIDDRRAIETSLIKGVNSTELDEKAQSRAREALEEYGFVARQCAALLLAPDAYERSSAARALGEIKSPGGLTIFAGRPLRLGVNRSQSSGSEHWRIETAVGDWGAPGHRQNASGCTQLIIKPHAECMFS